MGARVLGRWNWMNMPQNSVSRYRALEDPPTSHWRSLDQRSTRLGGMWLENAALSRLDERVGEPVVNMSVVLGVCVIKIRIKQVLTMEIGLIDKR